jgi:hypothetical protein
MKAEKLGFIRTKVFHMRAKQMKILSQKSRMFSLVLVWVMSGCGWNYTLAQEGDSRSTDYDSDTGSSSHDDDSDSSSHDSDSDSSSHDSDSDSSSHDSDSDSSSHDSASDSAVQSDTVLFYESFEGLELIGDDRAKIPGWDIAIGPPVYVNLVEEGVDEFTTAYGTTAVILYSSVAHDSAVMTTRFGLDTLLAADSTYTLSFNVGRLSNGVAPTTAFEVDLLAINDSAYRETVLESISGVARETDMSESHTLVFQTGATHENLGQRIAIRLSKREQASAGTRVLYDNIELAKK